MDIVIRQLDKAFLTENVASFISILGDVPGEYWNRDNFLTDLEGKYTYSCYSLILNDLAGYIISSKKDNITLHIHKFMVSKDYRNRFIGRELLGFFERQAKSGKMSRVTLKVRSDNEKGIRFYERYGFETISEQRIENETYCLLNLEKIL